MNLQKELHRIAFFGTPQFAVPTLERLLSLQGVSVGVVVTQPDKPAGRGHRYTPSPIKQCAVANNLPVLQPPSIKKRGPEFCQELSTFGPFSGAVVIAFGQILPQWLLDFFEGNAINIHASLLPRWRGAAPIQRAVMAGDTETGICLMKMEAGLDTGPVYVRGNVPLTHHDTGGTIHDLLSNEGGKLLAEHLVEILEGKILPTPQPEEGITYAHKIEKAEGLLQWEHSAAVLDPHIRGLSPFPGAFTFHQGRRIKILNCTRGPNGASNSSVIPPPGTILSLHKEGILVQCGEDTSLFLSLLLLEGKGALNAEAFLRGYPLSPGDQFGK